MNCTSCGKPLKPNIVFCTGCGNPVSAVPSAQSAPISNVEPVSPSTSITSLFKSKKRVCPSCGSPLKPTSRFCNGCGAPVEAQSRISSILTGILYIILGVVGILWNLISSKNDGTWVRTPGWRFLSATGYLYVIIGVIGILMSLKIFRNEFFASTIAFIVILNVWALVMGIMAMKCRQYPFKAKLLQNFAVVDLVLLGILLFFVPVPGFSRLMIIFSLISTGFGSTNFMDDSGFFLVLFLYIVEFAMPVCLLIGARKNLNSA